MSVCVCVWVSESHVASPRVSVFFKNEKKNKWNERAGPSTWEKKTRRTPIPVVATDACWSTCARVWRCDLREEAALTWMLIFVLLYESCWCSRERERERENNWVLKVKWDVCCVVIVCACIMSLCVKAVCGEKMRPDVKWSGGCRNEWIRCVSSLSLSESSMCFHWLHSVNVCFE